MTMMQGREAGVAEHHADELLDELTQLRATEAQLREEIVEVRRQRDDAISQAQWLVLRIGNAEKLVEELQAEVAALRPNGAMPVEPVVEVTTAVVDDSAAVAAEPVAEPVAVDAARLEDVVDVPVAGGPVAVTPVALVPGSWAGQAGPWLPPDDYSADGSMAQEFAALTERALAVEAEQAEAAVAAAPAPPPVEMNVLPGSGGGTKKASLFRRR